MKIAEITIKNFRCLKSISFKPQHICVLIGENDSGKTAILHAIRIILGRWRPVPDDLYTDNPNVSAREREPFEIEILLRPEDPQKGFSDDEHSTFFDHFDISDDGNERLKIKAKYGWNLEREEFYTEVRFQKKDGDGEEFTARYANQFGFFLIDALRDIGREIGNRTGLWGRLMSSISLSDTTQGEVITLFGSVYDVLQRDQRFIDIKNRFEDLIEGVLSLPQEGDNVRISPVPQDAAEILRGADLLVRSKGSEVFLPISQHGMGSQSVAVIALFRTLVEHREIPNIFFGFEEPEAHIHPHIQRHLFGELTNLGTQVFLTTHSTFIADRADFRDIVLLLRKGSECVARQIPDKDPVQPKNSFLPPDWEMTIKRYIEGNNSEIFFARCLLLVEGDSERFAFSLFLQAMGIIIDRLGISLITANSSNFAPFIRICSPCAFDIPWVVICDSDADKKVANQLKDTGYVTASEVKGALNTGKLATEILEANCCFVVPGNFETYLINNGFLDEYLKAIEELDGIDALSNYVRQRSVNTPIFPAEKTENQVLEYVNSHGKPRFARRVAELITSDGKDPSRIPTDFQRPLNTLKDKAEEALRS